MQSEVQGSRSTEGRAVLHLVAASCPLALSWAGHAPAFMGEAQPWVRPAGGANTLPCGGTWGAHRPPVPGPVCMSVQGRTGQSGPSGSGMLSCSRGAALGWGGGQALSAGRHPAAGSRRPSGRKGPSHAAQACGEGMGGAEEGRPSEAAGSLASHGFWGPALSCLPVRTHSACPCGGGGQSHVPTEGAGSVGPVLSLGAQMGSHPEPRSPGGTGASEPATSDSPGARGPRFPGGGCRAGPGGRGRRGGAARLRAEAAGEGRGGA